MNDSSLPEKALVTGAAGFTGRYVCQALRRAGYQVATLSRGRAFGPDAIQADLQDAPALAAAMERVRPDVVIHLAAVAFVVQDDATAFYRSNLVGTRNLLESLARTGSGQKGVVLASSANVYGNVTHGRPIREEDGFAPVNDYAVSKVAMEYMARLWQDKLPLVCVRPFNYTGVGQEEHFLVPKIVAHFKNRASRICLGNLDVKRDFSDVRFVADAYVGLLRAAPWGESVNICSGKASSIGDILAMCSNITGHCLEVEQDPSLMRAQEIATLLGSNQRLRTLVPGLPDIPFERTLEWMLTGAEA